MIKFIYKLFIGVLLATTIGMGIATFYPDPKAPEYPTEKYPYSQAEKTPSPADIQEQQAYDSKYKAFEVKRQQHSRNTALVAIALSLVILAISMTVLAKIDIFADGLLLGGIFTLLYGIIRSFGSGDQKFIFAATLIGLVAALVLGYLNFVKPKAPAEESRKT